VPEERVRPLADGETVDAAGHVMSVLFTPGHASHHVAYWLPEQSIVFTGDVGGVRMPGSDYALPPAPPPELAPGEWIISTERLRQTGAQRLLLTHGGAFDDANAHLDYLMPNLDEVGSLALEAMLAGAEDDAVTDIIQEYTETRIGPGIAEDPGIVQRYGWASPSFLSAMGFRRYLTKRGDLPTLPRP
jgi:glyoxylase-like metal-dependent hydrolase (beta-lactamase superfamily II)